MQRSTTTSATAVQNTRSSSPEKSDATRSWRGSFASWVIRITSRRAASVAARPIVTAAATISIGVIGTRFRTTQ
jgi:hypothetical protein